MITAWHSVEEIDAILATLLPRTDTRRMAWDQTNADDKPALVVLAQTDLDDCAWIGTRSSASQASSFPRCYGPGRTTPADGDTPAGVDAWSFAGVPSAVRCAHAVQAASRAAGALGLDIARPMLDNAAAGVVSVSGGGQSYALDAERAGTPRLRLDPLARSLVRPLLRHSAEVL